MVERTGRLRSEPTKGKRRVRAREASIDRKNTEDSTVVDEVFCLHATNVSSDDEETDSSDFRGIPNSKTFLEANRIWESVSTAMEENVTCLFGTAIAIVVFLFVLYFVLLIVRSAQIAKLSGSKSIDAFSNYDQGVVRPDSETDDLSETPSFLLRGPSSPIAWPSSSPSQQR